MQVEVQDLANAMLNSLGDAGMDVKNSDAGTLLHVCFSFATGSLMDESSFIDVPVDGVTEKLPAILLAAERFLMEGVLKTMAEQFIKDHTRHPDSKEAKESSFGIWDNKLYVL